MNSTSIEKGKVEIHLIVSIISPMILFAIFLLVSTNHYSSWKRELFLRLDYYAETLSYPVWTYDNRVIDKLTRVITQSADITGVFVYDDKRRELGSSDESYVPNILEQVLGVRLHNKNINLFYADTFVGSVSFRYTDSVPRVFLFYISLIFLGMYFILILLMKNLKKNEQLKELVEELNEMNNELELAFNELEEAQNKIINSEKMAALGKLMVNIAHDVNTPSGIIYSSLTEQHKILSDIKDKFEKDELTEEEFKDCLNTMFELNDMMVRNSRRIIELVQSLKRVAMNEMVQSYANVDLKLLVTDVLNSLHPKLRKTKINVVTDIEENLTIYTIPGAITQILMNLIDNAIVHAFEYDNPGEIRIEMKTITSGNNKELMFVFADNGKGIEPEIQKRIFEPFFTTDQKSGSGLGLSIVYQLVSEVLGGTIEVQSELWRGTKFIITLPIKEGN
ncbi:HAMP domain-containing histidine kinase [Fervidobacterium riparium]|uniref:histidine kinase n=1 Tax=Fervidobacterium gondwanense DSM 13020 TaxID=1121883 RepID=A0A1M7RZT9_FERGO|nr:HAMP domain-containing sensor histidine kinase [Fervidobacterium gondwanense]UXF00158.1 histidine kinase [Fervidobacterium riparium]SHN51731.1 Signal transduction histidine kinase [Fervidobacterium gondwanense DSM 13020]